MEIDIKTIRSVNKYLNLPATGDEQDWEIELANKFRLNEFIDFLIKTALSKNEKYALFALIVASYNDFISDHEDQGLKIWNEIIELVNQDKMLYTDVFNYWALYGDKFSDDSFSITPLVREYLSNNP